MLSTHLPTWSVIWLVYSPGTSLNTKYDPAASCNYGQQICTQIFLTHNLMFSNNTTVTKL